MGGTPDGARMPELGLMASDCAEPWEGSNPDCLARLGSSLGAVRGSRNERSPAGLGQARPERCPQPSRSGRALPSPAWALTPAQGHAAALPHTCAQTSTAVALPAGCVVSEARAAPVGALSSTGGAQEQFPGPGKANGFMALRTKCPQLGIVQLSSSSGSFCFKPLPRHRLPAEPWGAAARLTPLPLPPPCLLDKGTSWHCTSCASLLILQRHHCPPMLAA